MASDVRSIGDDRVLLELDSVRCTVVGRLNRFVARVHAPDGESLAHINNTGRLLDFMRQGAASYCIPRGSPGRTRYRLVAFDDRGGAALIDTAIQMSALESAIARGYLRWASGCSVVRRSPRLGDSVLDYLLNCTDRGPVYVEVKSAVMRGPGDVSMYPDCPTERGRRQISTMAEWASRGVCAAVVFIAAFPGASSFTPNDAGDPGIRSTLRAARSAGVELRAISMHYDGRRVVLDRDDLPVHLRRSAIRASYYPREMNVG
ncbi:MAG: DNA/RNA nuclease SfsA [Conexivisphaera sp.]|jgi:sugar fermentation stimulation protein A|nr:DNA/RNA nuclease SfsA [Conexivisphaerales archaeon]